MSGVEQRLSGDACSRRNGITSSPENTFVHEVTKEHEEKLREPSCSFVDIFIRTLVNASSWGIPLKIPAIEITACEPVQGRS